MDASPKPFPAAEQELRDLIVTTPPPTKDEVQGLDSAERDRIRTVLGDVWIERTDRSGSPAQRIKRTEKGWNCSIEDWHIVDWAATFRLSVAEDDWYALAAADLPGSGLNEWLPTVFERGWRRRIRKRLKNANEALTAVVLDLPVNFSRRQARCLMTVCLRFDNADLHEKCATQMVNRGFTRLLAKAARRSDSAAFDEVLIAHGDTAAEQRLVQRFQNGGFPTPETWGGDPHWLDAVQSPASFDLLARALQEMLERGDEVHDLMRVFRALGRSGGDRTIELLDRLIESDEIPSAKFLWYRRQEYIEDAVERRATEKIAELSAADLVEAMRPETNG